MIKQVTWTEYFTVLAVISAAYYVVIILLYYRNEVKSLFSGRRFIAGTGLSSAKPLSPVASNNRGPAEDTNVVSREQRLFADTNKLMQELKPVFEKEYVKAELIMALQTIVSRYPLLKGTAFQVSVNNYIEMESENQCSVSLSEHELRGLW